MMAVVNMLNAIFGQVAFLFVLPTYLRKTNMSRFITLEYVLK